MEKLKVGDIVSWRGTWGVESPKEAKVIGIQKTKYFREKYGDEVAEVNWNDHFVVTLDNMHWAYNFQLQPLTNLNKV